MVSNINWRKEWGETGIFRKTVDPGNLEAPLIWKIVKKRRTAFSGPDVYERDRNSPDIWHHYLEGKTLDGKTFSAQLKADGCNLNVRRKVNGPHIDTDDPIRLVVEKDGSNGFYIAGQGCFEEAWRMIDGKLAYNGGTLTEGEFRTVLPDNRRIVGCESIDSAKRGAGEKAIFPRIWARQLPNEAPVVADSTVEVDEDESVYISVYQSASDADGNTIKFRVIEGPTNGTLDDQTYAPNANFNGADSFTFVAFDDQQKESAPATVNITVLSVNDVPIANPQFDKSRQTIDR